MTEETAAEPQAAAESEAGGRTRRRMVVLIAIAGAALLTGLLTFAATRYGSVRSEVDQMEAVRRVAGEFGATTLTYDYRELSSFETRMKANATGTFRRQLSSGGLRALMDDIERVKSTSEATVKRVLVSEIDDENASAVVELEARARNGDGPLRRVHVHLDLQVVKAGGRWRIADVTTLDLGATPQATTTTSARSN